MLRARTSLFVVFAVVPAAVAAQPSSTGASPDQTTIRIEAEIAPEWATASPLTFEDSSDATSASLAIIGQHKFTENVILDIRFGPSARLDSDGDDKPGAGSSFGASAELSLMATERVGIFGSLGYKAGFSDFFNEDGADERNYSAGLKYELPILYIGDTPSTIFNARAFYTLSDSTNDAKDAEAAHLRVNWANPIRSWGLFALEGTLARRWYQNADLVTGYEERVDDWGISAGIDVAPLLRRVFGDDAENPWIRKVRGGVGYFESNSNIDANDNDGTVRPVVSIVLGRAF